MPSQTPIAGNSTGTPPAKSLRNSIDLAKHVDQLGYTRYWLAVGPALLILAGAPFVLWALTGYRLSRAAFAPTPPTG